MPQRPPLGAGAKHALRARAPNSRVLRTRRSPSTTGGRSDRGRAHGGRVRGGARSTSVIANPHCSHAATRSPPRACRSGPRSQAGPRPVQGAPVGGSNVCPVIDSQVPVAAGAVSASGVGGHPDRRPRQPARPARRSATPSTMSPPAISSSTNSTSRSQPHAASGFHPPPSWFTECPRTCEETSPSQTPTAGSMARHNDALFLGQAVDGPANIRRSRVPDRQPCRPGLRRQNATAADSDVVGLKYTSQTKLIGEWRRYRAWSEGRSLRCWPLTLD